MNTLRKYLTRTRQPNRAPRPQATSTQHVATHEHQVAQHAHHIPPLSLSVR